MDASKMKAMTEATRLTREGRLAEATALIQHTLANPAEPWQASDAPSGRGTKLRRAIPGWLTRRRTLPSQADETLVRPSQPACSRAMSS